MTVTAVEAQMKETRDIATITVLDERLHVSRSTVFGISLLIYIDGSDIPARAQALSGTYTKTVFSFGDEAEDVLIRLAEKENVPIDSMIAFAERAVLSKISERAKIYSDTRRVAPLGNYVSS